jgi:hypothetical protein
MRRLLALAALAMPGTASAQSLCESLKAIIAANGHPAPAIIPDGWVSCTAEPHAYRCQGPGGRPQATVHAHLYAVNAEIAACYAMPGTETGEDRRSFQIEPGIAITTYTEGFGTPEGGIRLRIEFVHPS